MRLFFSTLVAAVTLPATVNAEVTLESFEALRAEALSFQSSAEATQEGQVKARFEHSISSALTGVYPQDFAPEVLTRTFRERAACLSGDHDACVAVADLYRDGEDTLKDLELATELYWLGCSEGHGTSCERFDEIRDVSVSARDLPYPNLPFHLEACDAGVAASCLSIYRDMYAFFEDFTQAEQESYGDRACALDPALSMCAYRLSDAEKEAARKARFIEVSTACAAGEAEGCYFQGAMSYRQDPAGALDLFAQSCEGGHAAACGRASDAMLEKGNLDAAHAFLQQQCASDAASCGRLAAFYEDGRAQAPDEGEVERLYAVACEASIANGRPQAKVCQTWEGMSFDIFAASALDLIYEEMHPDFSAAQTACAEGDGQSCYELGFMAYGHQWIAGNEKHQGLSAGAQDAFALGCEHGHAPSCVRSAGGAYEPGTGHPLDLACEAGHGASCMTIIRHESFGTDAARVAALDEQCAGGSGAACSTLSQYITTGGSFAGSRRDIQLDDARQAAALARQACDLGDGAGCAQQGWYLDPTINSDEFPSLKGTSDEALALYTRACELGDLWGCDLARGSMPGNAGMEIAMAACKLGSCEGVYETRLHKAHADDVAAKGLIPAVAEADLNLFFENWHGAIRRHQRACAAGEAAGCGALGLVYAGAGEERILRADIQFLETGLALFTHACETGATEYCQIASDYMPKDTAEEQAAHIAFMEDQCRADQAWACSKLAYAFEDEDPRRVEAIIAACRLGDAYRCGDLYWTAFDAPEHAERILATGCAWGEAYDCVELANSHLMDRVPLAKVVLELGCETGERDACRALQRLN